MSSLLQSCMDAHARIAPPARRGAALHVTTAVAVAQSRARGAEAAMTAVAKSSKRHTTEESPEYLSLEPSGDLEIGREGMRLDLGGLIGMPGSVAVSKGLSYEQSEYLGVYRRWHAVNGRPCWRQLLRRNVFIMWSDQEGYEGWVALGWAQDSYVTLESIQAGEGSAYGRPEASLLLRGNELPHRSLSAWEVRSSDDTWRSESGLTCRSLAALPPTPPFLQLDGGKLDSIDLPANIRGIFKLEPAGCVSATISETNGTVKVKLRADSAAYPRRLNGSPVWRHLFAPYYIVRSPAGYQWTLQTEQGLGTNKAYLGHSDSGAITPDGCRQGRWEAFVDNAWILDASLRCIRLDALPDPPEYMLLEGASVVTRSNTALPTGYYRLARETHATLSMAISADGTVSVGLCVVRRLRRRNDSPVWEHTVLPQQLLARGKSNSDHSYIAGHTRDIDGEEEAAFLFCLDKSCLYPSESSEWNWWDGGNWHYEGLICRAMNELPKPPAALLLEAQGTLDPDFKAKKCTASDTIGFPASNSMDTFRGCNATPSE